MYLIIAPHIDDEVLGCFSAFSHDDVHVLYCGYDESKINDGWVKKRPTTSRRLEELNNLCEHLGFTYTALSDNIVNEYKISDLISPIEKEINDIKPDRLYIPVPSYNQDHRVVYESALTALRPHDLNHFVPQVLVYEQIQDLWNHNYRGFNPTFFSSVDIEEKINSYSILESQVRNFRSPDMLRTLASLRGIQANVEYAEGFEVIRWVE